MSKVKIQGNASGTGVVTLTAPNTDTDRTITLPDSTGTVLDSTSTLDATKLSGALPAIDGSSLTGISGGATDIDGLSDGTTSGTNCVGLGSGAVDSMTSGNECVGVGVNALTANTTGYDNTAVGHQCSAAMTSGWGNVAVGSYALDALNAGSENVAVGHAALSSITGHSNSTAVGYEALKLATADQNTAVGYRALWNNTTGSDNTAIGYSAMNGCTTGAGNIAIGDYAGTSSSPYNVTTQTNKVVMGNNSVGGAYIKVSWSVTSDERDKADITEMSNGLDVVKNITPINYVWDTRSDYFTYEEDEDGNEVVVKNPSDGSKKDIGNLRTGFSAQNVKAALDAVGYQGNSVVDSEDPENLKVTETNLIPFLVNAVKELSAKVETLEAQLNP